MILFVNSIFENVYFIFLLTNYENELYHNFVDLSIMKKEESKNSSLIFIITIMLSVPEDLLSAKHHNSLSPNQHLCH